MNILNIFNIVEYEQDYDYKKQRRRTSTRNKVPVLTTDKNFENFQSVVSRTLYEVKEYIALPVV
ncbi:hypothetical protein VU04_03570 [Desulfobulbus sp. TB]|nr:hypothetical protein [Desulfobulbus sp. TB]